MRRTHIMHKRDNRRAFYLIQADPMDKRPVAAWSGNQQESTLTIDGAPMAKVVQVGEPDYNWHTDEWTCRYDCIILAGPRATERKAFDDRDSARMFGEQAVKS